MKFRISCPRCGQHLSAGTQFSGTMVRCPNCSGRFRTSPLSRRAMVIAEVREFSNRYGDWLAWSPVFAVLLFFVLNSGDSRPLISDSENFHGATLSPAYAEVPAEVTGMDPDKNAPNPVPQPEAESEFSSGVENRGVGSSYPGHIKAYTRHTYAGSSHTGGSSYSGSGKSRPLFKTGPVAVRSYTRKDGTRVAAHTRTHPDGIRSNNHSASHSRSRSRSR